MEAQPQTSRSLLHTLDRWLEHSWVRFAAFWLTFVLAFMLLIRDFEYFPFIIFFPVGLFMLIVGRQGMNSGALPAIAGWLIFLTVSIVGSAAPRRKTFLIWYIVFVVLLIANIVGCTRQSW